MTKIGRLAAAALIALGASATASAAFLNDSTMHGGGGGTGKNIIDAQALDRILFSPHEPYTVKEDAFELTAVFAHTRIEKIDDIEIDDSLDVLVLSGGFGLTESISLSLTVPLLVNGLDFDDLDTEGFGDVGFGMRYWNTSDRQAGAAIDWGFGADLIVPTGNVVEDERFGLVGPGGDEYIGSLDVRLGWHNAPGTRRGYLRAGSQRALSNNGTDYASSTVLMGAIRNRHGFGEGQYPSNLALWVALATTSEGPSDANAGWEEQLRVGGGWAAFPTGTGSLTSVVISGEVQFALTTPPNHAPTRFLLTGSLLFNGQGDE